MNRWQRMAALHAHRTGLRTRLAIHQWLWMLERALA